MHEKVIDKKYVKHLKKLEPETWLPEDIQIAINTFIQATIMLEENDLPYVPSEYVINLLDVIKKHKEYNFHLIFPHFL